MKICIITNNYPIESVSYGGAFVHARAKLYLKEKHEVLVVVPTNNIEIKNYNFESVEVISSNERNLKKIIEDYNPNIICIHSPYFRSSNIHLANFFVKKIPIIAWIHGSEALLTSKYYYHKGIIRNLASIPLDIVKFSKLKHFLSQINGVVYVSDWMKRECEKSIRFVHRNSIVIPNPIDTSIFKPVIKKNEGQLKGIALRSLGNKKYGLDIAIKAFSELKETSLTIVGTGPLEDSLRKLVKNRQSNVEIIAETVNHLDVPKLLNKYDYFVAPSRTEAQGVAMCEAMACGLPVIATNVGGIPEFVRHNKDGFLVEKNNVVDLRNHIKKLVNEPETYKNMRKNACDRIQSICSSEIVVKKEIEFINNQLV